MHRLNAAFKIASIPFIPYLLFQSMVKVQKDCETEIASLRGQNVELLRQSCEKRRSNLITNSSFFR